MIDYFFLFSLRWYVEEKDYDYYLPDEEEYEDDNEQSAPQVPGLTIVIKRIVLGWTYGYEVVWFLTGVLMEIFITRCECSGY